jgi:hypothetical protein
VNRLHGIAALYASQILPFRDPKSVALTEEFMMDVSRVKSELG